MSAHAIKPTHVVSAIPAQATFVRNLPLPFRDPRKIREVLKFEIEPHIPYPVEDVIVDFAKIRNLDTGGCEVLAAAVSKKVMADHLHILGLAGLAPEVVDWEIFGELNSYLAWRPLQSRAVALINLGAARRPSKSFKMAAFDSRSIVRGGNALTESIRQHLTLTSAQAEAMKLVIATATEPVSPKRLKLLGDAGEGNRPHLAGVQHTCGRRARAGDRPARRRR